MATETNEQPSKSLTDLLQDNFIHPYKYSYCNLNVAQATFDKIKWEWNRPGLFKANAVFVQMSGIRVKIDNDIPDGGWRLYWNDEVLLYEGNIW